MLRIIRMFPIYTRNFSSRLKQNRIQTGLKHFNKMSEKRKATDPSKSPTKKVLFYLFILLFISRNLNQKSKN